MLDFTDLSSLKSPPIEVKLQKGRSFRALDIEREVMEGLRGVLYAHVHRASRKVYFGITKMQANARWQSGQGYTPITPFGLAVQQEGWQTFTSYILCVHQDRNLLSKLEVEAITYAGGHKSTSNYNSSPGGDFVSDNTKPIIGYNLVSGERREFPSGVVASKELGIKNSDMVMAVARGERISTQSWAFAFKGKEIEPPSIWGEQRRIARIKDVFSLPITAINLATGESRNFNSVSDAARALGVLQSAISRVLTLEDCHQAGGWWFKPTGSVEEPPALFGAAAIRAKRDKAVHAHNYLTGERKTFKNCTAADESLGVYAGASSAVIGGERASAGDWWFTHDPEGTPPSERGGTLVAKARSKPVRLIHVETGKVYRYPSAKIAGGELNIHRSSICTAIKSGKPLKGYLVSHDLE